MVVGHLLLMRLVFTLSPPPQYTHTHKQEIGYSGGYKDCGVLSVEHLGKPHGKYDGFCVTHLYQADSLELNSSDFQWTVVPEPLATRLRTSMSIGGSASFFRL